MIGLSLGRTEDDPRSLTIVLKYGRDRQSAIDGIRRRVTEARSYEAGGPPADDDD